MTCIEAQRYLDAYADAELDLAATLEIESHLKSCAACAGRCQNIQTLRTALSDRSLYYEAPARLQSRIRSAIAKSAGTGAMLRWNSWVWRSALVALTALLLVSFNTLYFFRGASEEDLLVQEVVASHVRSLQANHLMDVPSSDQHTVKPWFNGKLDFSPQVVDLADQGFPLVGGRLDVAANRPVAALVYQRRKHFINVFEWPSASNESLRLNSWTRNGYNVIHWSALDMSFWAVSDVAMPDLQEFAQLLQHR